VRAELHERSGPALKEVWEALYRADPSATPQSSFAWADAWLAQWAPEAKPVVVTIWDGSEAAGLAAFALHRRGPFRLLRVLGEYPSDYWDVLARPECRAEAAQIAAAALAEAPEWDAVFLEHLSPGSPMAGAMGGAGLDAVALGREPYPGMALPQSFDEYLNSLPQSRRTNLRRRLRHLDDGEVELREITAVGDVRAAVERWQELRVRQWEELGRDLAPEHRSPRFGAFLAAALEGLLPAGQVEFWEFRHGDRLVGSYIGLVDERCFYQYLGGYDPAFARFGVGKIAIGHGIRTSIEAGRTYYDFMMGGEPYKYWYGAGDRFCDSYFVSDRRLRSRAARAVFRWRSRRR
jgi:CelD/BcsL family acetyltransferase involved in cellulose biosynthesis